MRYALSLFLLCLGLSTSLVHAQVNLAKDGQSSLSIYVHPVEMQEVVRIRFNRPNKQTSELKLAVGDLQYHLAEMTGVSMPIVETDDAASIPSPAIVVGQLAAELGAKPAATPWQESYRILTKDDRLLIAGERLIASSYGVYGFLRELGCEWTIPGPMGEVIPRIPSLTVTDIDRTESPAFALRNIWIGGRKDSKWTWEGNSPAEWNQWVRRQRFGVAEEYRDRVSEGHMWHKLISTYKDEFKANPEMLALVRRPNGDSIRRGPQIETANPDTVAIGARFIRETFEKNKWAKDRKVTLPIGPADGLGFSESPESRAAGTDRTHPIGGYKDHTDLVVHFADQVLQALGDDYPNLTLGFYVYSTHNQYPERYELNPRVLPILAPISYSRYHSTIDPHSKSRAFYRGIVEQYGAWAERTGSPILVYEYNWNLADNLLPYTRVRSVAEDIQFYHANGVTGWNMQAMKVASTAAAHNVIFARMLWDPSLDWRELLHDFSVKAYGPAAEPMERYQLRIAKLQSEAGEEGGSFFSAKLIFDEEFLIASRADFAEALAAKGLTEKQRWRVLCSQFSFTMLDTYLQWEWASEAYDFAKAAELGEVMHATYNAAMAHSSHLYGRAGRIYINRLILKSTEGQLTHSTAPYTIVQKLPDELPSMFDPTNQGERMNLFAPEINDRNWVKTKTYSSTWDAQGLGLLRAGSVWYRTRVTVPADLKGQGVGLLLGAFEDEARVWVNGAYMGSTGIKYPQAAAVDLTDAIRFGDENLIAIKIIRNSNANELLLGGVLRPSFVFTGPRVETAKPSPHRVRVLPGGGIEIIKE